MLDSGTRLGPFEIKELVGRGGMGEVYSAHDSKLNRHVAIKVLPPAFAADPDRVARFEREAKTLAALNHPNIAQIHGLEDAGSTRAIVMELVEGEDLADLIARGPLPRPRALTIARQLADAVQAAHDLGIVHRDLKPANVKIKPDGMVKVLDFGLAKVVDTADSRPLTVVTLPGTLLGTLAYMSPEQIEGQPGDVQADVWAFGCIVFEMLTGNAPFASAPTSGIINSVLTAEPDWNRLPRDTPEPLRRLLRRCLEKDKSNRLRALADARLELDDARVDHGAAQQPTRTAVRTKTAAFAIVIALIGIALVWGFWSGRRASPPPEVRFEIATPEVSDPGYLPGVAVSADDRQVLFVANYEGQPHVWSREIDRVSARPLPGTGGAIFPFWSPDNRSVAFHADGYLKRLDLDGGLVRILANVTVGLGGAWNRDGVILFVRNPASAIARVSAEGGEVADVTRVEAGQVGHAFPHFLPDGTHFLFYVTASPESRGVHLGQLGEASSRRLLDADGGGVYANGHVLFVRERNVYAQAFDAERLELAGRPFQVAEGIYGLAGGQSLTLSAGASAFAFRSGVTRNARQFTWVDRSGNQIAAVGDPLGNPDGVSWSPDLGQAVFFERGPSSSDLWTIDIRRGLVSRFSEEPDEDIFPLWTRDGTRIVYTAVRNGAHSLYSKQVGTGVREVLLPEQRRETFVSDVSPDGRQLVYQQMAPNAGFDIWVLPLDGGPAAPIVQTDANERAARLSPDGRWLAFVANNSGAFEVYVQPFPGPGPRLQVSSKGGDQPQWQADGDELFFVSADAMLMAAPVSYATDGSSIDIGEPIALFAPGIGGASPVLGANYGASADGQRFLVNRLLPDASATPVRVILNWNAEAAAAAER